MAEVGAAVVVGVTWRRADPAPPPPQLRTISSVVITDVSTKKKINISSIYFSTHSKHQCKRASMIPTELT